MLQLKQIYFTNKVQKGEMFYLGQLKKVNSNIIEWYDIESSKIVLQSRVEDVQQSEKKLEFSITNSTRST